MNKPTLIAVLISIGLLFAVIYIRVNNSDAPVIETKEPAQAETIEKSDEEWKAQLTEEQYYVTREHGTERAFSGEYWDNKADGTYRCVCCDLPLFSSETKYESGTGWPSFWQPITDENIGTSQDNKLLYVRTEVHCRRCKAHLGHVFSDGPDPTGLRYCLNSAALDFEGTSNTESNETKAN